MGLNKEAMGEFELALVFYEDQIRICKELLLFEDLAWAISNQGDVLRKLGKLNKALESYLEQEKISQVHNLTYWLKMAVENIGEVYKDYGQYATAASKYELLQKISADQTSLKFFGCALENQADIFYRTGDLEKAGEAYFKAADHFTEPGDLFDQWRLLTKSAVIYDTLDQKEQYDICITRKRELIPLIDNELLFAYLLLNQDHTHTIRFDLDLIYEWYEKNNLLKKISETISSPVYQSLKIYERYSESRLIQPDEFAMIQKIGNLCKEHRFEMGLQYYYGFKGLYEMISHDSNSAQFSFTQQKEQCKKIGYFEGLQIALSRIGDIFYSSGDFAHAKSFTEDQLTLARKLNSPESLLRGDQRLIDISLKEEEFSLAQKNLEMTLKSAEILGSFHQIALCYYKIGLINQSVGSAEEAQKYFIQQEEIACKARDKYYKVIALLKQAEVLEKMHKNLERDEVLKKLL